MVPKPTFLKKSYLRTALVLTVLCVIGIFSFQNCGGFTGISASELEGAIGQSSASGSTASPLDTKLVATLTAAIGPEAAAFTAMGLSNTDLQVLEGQTLLNGTVTPAQITQAQGDADGLINTDAAMIASTLSAAQLTTLETTITSETAAISAYDSASLSMNGALLQAADLEILTRLKTAITAAPTNPTTTDATFAAALAAALKPFASDFSLLGISQNDVNILEGQTLINGTASPSQISGAQSDVDAIITKNAKLIATSLSATQIATLKTAVSTAQTAIGAYPAGTLSTNATFLQAADLEILSRLASSL